MPEDTKRNSVESDTATSNESVEEVSNDSLGTVNTSDSTGLDESSGSGTRNSGPEKPAKREPGIAPS